MGPISGRSLVIALALSSALGSAAVASPVTYQFAGIVGTSDIPTINVGDKFSGHYTFESTTPALGGSNSTTAVFNALKSLSFTISGKTYSSSASAEIQVGNQDGVNEFTDRLAVVSRASEGLSGPIIPGGVVASDFYVIDGFILRLDDSTGNLFSTALDLPTDVTLADFDDSSFFINFLEIDIDPTVTGRLTAFGPAAIPEPMTLSLFAFGVAGAAALRRRKAKV